MDTTGYKRWSINTLIRHYNLHGEAGVRDLRQDNGSEPTLDAAQQQQLLTALGQPPPGDGFRLGPTTAPTGPGRWSGPRVRRYVREHFGVDITQVCLELFHVFRLQRSNPATHPYPGDNTGPTRHL